MHRRTFLGAGLASSAAILTREGKAQPAPPKSPDASPRPWPLAPRSVVAADVTAKRVVLAWREPYHHEDLTAYVVYRDFRKLAEVNDRQRTYTDEAVEPGKTYVYTVRARNAAGRESVASGLYGYSGFHPSRESGAGRHIVLHYAPHLPFLTGASISIFWKDIEKEEGRPDWQYVDQALEMARAAGKRVLLWSYTSNENWTPEWLRPRVRFFEVPGKGRYPYFLDPEMIRAWEGFVTRLGARYGSHPALEHVLVACGGSYSLAPGDVGEAGEQALKRLKADFGYTEEAHVAAWARAFDLYTGAFPEKALTYAVMYLNRTAEPALVVAENALRKHGSRVRVQTENLNGNPWWRTQPYTWGFSHANHRLARLADRASIGWQMLSRSWKDGGGPEGEDRGANGPLAMALDNGIAFEGSWVEVWKEDLPHREYEPTLRRAAAALGVVTVNVP